MQRISNTVMTLFNQATVVVLVVGVLVLVGQGTLLG